MAIFFFKFVAGVELVCKISAVAKELVFSQVGECKSLAKGTRGNCQAGAESLPDEPSLGPLLQGHHVRK